MTTLQPTRETLQRLEAQNLAALEQTHIFLAIRDLDGKGFGLPTPALSVAHFVRELESNLTENHNMMRYADRFEIYEVGGFNYHNGHVVTSEPRRVGLISDLIRRPDPNQPKM